MHHFRASEIYGRGNEFARLGDCAMARPGAGHGLHVAIRIDNYPQIAAAFGLPDAERLLGLTREALRAQCSARGVQIGDILSGGDGRLELLIASDDPDCLPIVRSCCLSIAAMPVNLNGMSVLPVLSIDVPPGNSGPEHCSNLPGLRAIHGEPAMTATGGGFPDVSSSLYAREMAAAASLLSDIRTDSVLIAWQPVRHADNPLEKLYDEALLCMMRERSAVEPELDRLLAAERIGAISAIDCHVVSRALDELEAWPWLSLGVKISVCSAKPGFWWDELLCRLARDRSLGPRLFLEIGGGAPILQWGDAISFVDGMRTLGCRIVISDFGTGYSSVRTVMALKPDIVKIDPFFLATAVRNADGRKAYQHIAGLAAAIAGTVIADGVDSAEASSIAAEAGTVWQQGLYQGAPSLFRPWAHEEKRPQRALGDSLSYEYPRPTSKIPAHAGAA